MNHKHIPFIQEVEDKTDETTEPVVLFPHKTEEFKHLSDDYVKLAVISLVIAVAATAFAMALVIPHF